MEYPINTVKYTLIRQKQSDFSSLGKQLLDDAQFLPGRLALLFLGFTVALLQFGGNAGAQEGPLNPTESGGIGFAGMLAGLLVVALATLAVRHRGSESLAARLARVEALLEARDDRIWALEETLVRTTKLAVRTALSREVSAEIEARLRPFAAALTALDTIPGVGRRTVN